MRLRADCLAVLTLALTVGLPALACAFPILAATPLDNPFRVQIDTQRNHSTPSVARDADGDFVVAWYSYTDASQDVDVYARRFDASGTPLGDEFRVNSSTFGIQILVTVGMDAEGDFVIAWRSNEPAPTYTPLGIYGQRFDSSGQPVGGEFKINTDAPGAVADINDPKVTMAANGRFVAVWREISDVYARLYDAEGQPIGPEITVAKPNSGDAQPTVAMDAAGNFVVAWANITSEGQDIYARLYEASGAPRGPAFKADQDVIGNDAQFPHFLPSATMDAQGSFVVAWGRRKPNIGGDLYARRFSGFGVPRGDAFVVNSLLNTTDFWTTVDADVDGDFVIVWDTQRAADIIGRRYGSDGLPLEEEFQVNEAGFRDCCLYTQSVALDADGDFVVVWSRLDSGDVYGRRYEGPDEVDLSVTVADRRDPVAPASDFAYDVVVTNHEAAVTPTGVPALDAGIGTATSVRVDIALPAEAGFRSFEAPGWTCTRAGTDARCTLAKLAPGVSSAVTINLTAPSQEGTVVLTAAVDGDQADTSSTANNSDSDTTTIDMDAVDAPPAAAPMALVLHPVLPNPVRRSGLLRFELPRAAPVSLELLDTSGRSVRRLVDADLPPGRHEARLHTDDLAAGLYFVRLRAGPQKASRGFIVIP